MEDETEDLTVPQAAALYGCSKSNMAYLVASGRVPSRRLSRLIIVKRADIIVLKTARDSREHQNAWIQPVGETA